MSMENAANSKGARTLPTFPKKQTRLNLTTYTRMHIAIVHHTRSSMSTGTRCDRFPQLVANAVLAMDINTPTLQAVRKKGKGVQIIVEKEGRRLGAFYRSKVNVTVRYNACSSTLNLLFSSLFLVSIMQ